MLPAPIELVVIGVSTGGPNALAATMPAFPSDFPVPIVIVQHTCSINSVSLLAATYWIRSER